MCVNIVNASKKTNIFVLVAQLDRVFGYEPKGRGFESLQARQNGAFFTMFRFFFFLILNPRNNGFFSHLKTL